MAQRKAAIAKERERLVVPADPEAIAKLAPRYVNPSLGELQFIRKENEAWLDVGEWKTAVASRKNDDGTISIVTIDPTLAGFEFVVADEPAARRLILRDAQARVRLKEAAPEDGGGEPLIRRLGGSVPACDRRCHHLTAATEP